VKKQEKTYRFSTGSAASKGESSSGRVVGKGVAIIHNLNSGVELIRGDDVLKMLYILNTPVAVLQFRVKNYEMRDNSQLLENQSQVRKNLPTVLRQPEDGPGTISAMLLYRTEESLTIIYKSLNLNLNQTNRRKMKKNRLRA
jgi:hypothetical protein